MKKAMFFVFIIFSLTGCVVAQQQVSPSVSAVTADQHTWDFGKIKAGAVVKHDFILKNETDKALKVKDVTTSCGCTATKIKNKELAPGESTVIEAQFNSKGYSGSVQQYVYVNTDNLDNSIIKFIIKAEIAK